MDEDEDDDDDDWEPSAYDDTYAAEILDLDDEDDEVDEDDEILDAWLSRRFDEDAA
jgi:hypothetical protein